MGGTAAPHRPYACCLNLAMALLAAACQSPHPRQPVQPALGHAQTEERVTIVGAQGVRNTRQAVQDLAQVRSEGRPQLLQRQLTQLLALGDVHLYRGNSAQVLIDGPETFAAMKAAIASARDRILLEAYIIEDEGVAAEIGELLLQKAAEGVGVALLYDSIGSLTTDSAFFENLEKGGVAVCAFNPVNPLERPGRWGLWQRNHRKLVAVDNEVAFTGGMNLSNVYAQGSLGSAGRFGRTSPMPSGGWRDTQIALRGPVVSAMADLFGRTWVEQACEGALPEVPRAKPQARGERVVKLVAGDPRDGVNPTYTALMAAVDASMHSVYLTMAYFAPGPDLVAALADAARRGVDVALVLPGQTDVALTLHAARSYYAQLLEAGVQIHEMRGAVMHAKTAVVDGVFSTIGSSNMDWRSIVANSEMDVIVLGDDFGREMEAFFREDVANSEPISPERWHRRGLGQRLLETLGRLFEPLL